MTLTTQAFLYARFSSSQQTDGHSLERQLMLARDYCQRHSLELSDKTFADLGISGWSAKKEREGLETLLEAVKEGRIPAGSHILVEAADRLSRQGWTVVSDLVRDLIATGCVFVTIENGQQFNKTNINDFARTALPLMLSADLAKQESDRKSQRIAAAKKKVRDQGRLEGSLPFWLSKTDTVQFNEFKNIARRIVDLRLEGWSAFKIARLFNGEGIKPAKAKAWSQMTIQQTIKNTLLYGMKTYKDGSTSAGVAPAVCSYDEFKQIQPVTGKKRVAEVGPYSGLLRCADCGSALVVKAKRDQVVYRMCAGQLSNSCNATGTYRNIDQVLDKELHRLGVIKQREPSALLADIDQRLGVLESERSALEALRAASRGNVERMIMILDDLLAVKNEIAELNKQKTDIQSQSRDADFIRAVDIEDTQHKNKVLRSLISRIDCKKTGQFSGQVIVRLRNGHQISMIVKWGRWLEDGHEVMFKTDGEKLKDWLRDNKPEEWEREE